MSRIFVSSLLCVALTGCLGVPTPQEELASSIGTNEGGPEHNPGQPCVLCHSGDIFVGGTVYNERTDPNDRGIRGVTVTLTDANGDEFVGHTNGKGNFFFSEGGFEDAARLPFTPVFPLHARISDGALEQEMVTPIHRERSCSACHRGDPDVDSVGRIYLVEPP